MLNVYELQYEVVTPLYLGGFASRDHKCRLNNHGPDDDGFKREIAELRWDAGSISARPIVDSWRWWFRALVGGIIGTDAGARRKLRALEWQYFGGTGDDVAALCGKVAVLEGTDLPVRAYGQGRPWEAAKDNTDHKKLWASFLGYGLSSAPSEDAHTAIGGGCLFSEPKRGARFAPTAIATHPRFGIVSESSFKVRVIADSCAWSVLFPVVAVAARLGGLGARSRRALGSVQISEVSENNRSVGAMSAADTADVVRWCRAELVRELGLTPRAIAADEPEFAIVQPGMLIRETTLPDATWWEVLASVRNQLRIDHERSDAVIPSERKYVLNQASKGFRQQHTNGAFNYGQSVTRKDADPFPYWHSVDHDAAWGARYGAQKQEAVNILGGLPIPYQFSKAPRDRRKVTVVSAGERWPSPLSFRVRKNESGPGFKVLTILMKRQQPKGVRIKELPGTEYRWSKDWSRLETFVRSCGSEVIVEPLA